MLSCSNGNPLCPCVGVMMMNGMVADVMVREGHSSVPRNVKSHHKSMVAMMNEEL